MISHKEAQELQELVSWLSATAIDHTVDNGYDVVLAEKDTDRALELVKLIMADTGIEKGFTLNTYMGEDGIPVAHVETHTIPTDSNGPVCRVYLNDGDPLWANPDLEENA